MSASVTRSGAAASPSSPPPPPGITITITITTITIATAATARGCPPTAAAAALGGGEARPLEQVAQLGRNKALRRTRCGGEGGLGDRYAAGARREHAQRLGAAVAIGRGERLFDREERRRAEGGVQLGRRGARGEEDDGRAARVVREAGEELRRRVGDGHFGGVVDGRGGGEDAVQILEDEKRRRHPPRALDKGA